MGPSVTKYTEIFSVPNAWLGCAIPVCALANKGTRLTTLRCDPVMGEQVAVTPALGGAGPQVREGRLDFKTEQV